jgi:hypothetical protein
MDKDKFPTRLNMDDIGFNTIDVNPKVEYVD